MANNVDDLVGEINKLNNLLTRREEKETGETAKNTAGIWATSKVTLAVEREIKKVLESSLNLHEKSLGRGLSLQNVLKATRSQQLQMAGTLTGFATAVKIGYEQFESGLKSNNAATNELALYTKLTGGSSLKLLKGLASLTRGMNISGDQETALSKTIFGLSQNFKMTAEEIVDAVQGLGESMRTFKILGIGPQMAEGAAILTAALGKQAGDMGSQLISSLMSAEGYVTARLLGVTEERLALAKGEGDANTNMIRMIEKSLTKADDIVKRAGEAADPAIILNELEKFFGKGLGNAVLVLQQLQRESGGNWRQQLRLAAEKQQTDKDYTTSWNNFKDKIMSPIQERLMKFTGKILEWAVENKKFVEELLFWASVSAGYLAIMAGVKGVGKILGMGGKATAVAAVDSLRGARAARLARVTKSGWKFGLGKLGKLLLKIIRIPLMLIGGKIGLVILALGGLVWGISKLFSREETKKTQEALNRKQKLGQMYTKIAQDIIPIAQPTVAQLHHYNPNASRAKALAGDPEALKRHHRDLATKRIMAAVEKLVQLEQAKQDNPEPVGPNLTPVNPPGRQTQLPSYWHGTG